MKEDIVTRIVGCPCQGKTYTEHPALSRMDNKKICLDCGIREALDGLGTRVEEQESILDIIHRANTGQQ